ncbi:hypothetical protein ACFQ2B_33990 [Streptomyces stramineus]
MPFPGNPANRGPLIGGYYRAVLGVPGDRAAAVPEWLSALPPDALLTSADEAAAQLARGTHALSTGDAPISVRA